MHPTYLAAQEADRAFSLALVAVGTHRWANHDRWTDATWAAYRAKVDADEAWAPFARNLLVPPTAPAPAPAPIPHKGA